MKKMSVAEIRESFLSFFESKGSTREKSSSLVPINDPTLLFTSAGMVQFKDVFTGNEKRPYTRATTAQKCLRAGGKHNDLENVGFTSRHHTFFEMLGNFSFGDYFKKEAITWAWELATEVFQLPRDHLHVTVFREDDEAYEIWHKVVGVPKERIYRFDEKDNFWSAGDVGPCGPCTEIYFDRGPGFNTGNPELDRMGGDGDRYLEFYNLVFMQYNRDASGHLSPLPKPSVDTGMGLERIASILQEAPTNYDIDIFQSIIRAVEQISGYRYEQGMKEKAVATRVIADHLRAISFLIADGVLPSNEGRGYVLRRILRRAVRYGKKLGLQSAFLEKLVPALVSAMGAAYPELREKEKFVRDVIRAEEEKFFQTLERGLQILSEELAKLKKGQKLPGQVAFLLYDSFGFPLDLTSVVAKEQGIEVDEKGFEQCMEKQRAQSRAAQEGENLGENSLQIFGELAKKFPATRFTGYEAFEGEGKVLALIQNGQEVKAATAGSFDAIFDSSPFYGESGGQVGDSGEILAGAKRVAQVKQVKKPLPSLTVVSGVLEAGAKLEVNQTYLQRLPREVRLKTMANHSATHLLHWALRKVLGTHVKQAGSLVSPDLLRFDFTHIKGMTEAEKEEVENLINDRIAASERLQTKLMNKDQAIAAGAVALFGEKYDDEVRVVSIGDGFSTELCGGTHVENTAQIGCFVIVSEGGVAAGVRRIVAYTSSTAIQYLKQKARALDTVRESLKATSPEDAVAKVERLQAREKELEKRISAMQAESAAALAKELVAKAQQRGNTRVITHILPEGGAEALKTLGERLRDHLPSGVIALGAADPAQGKAFLQVLVSPDLAKTYHAGKLIQASAPLIEGKGGGKPEQAQAGGPKIAGLAPALDHILSLL
jgi:alanyl-tRNA synthetase